MNVIAGDINRALMVVRRMVFYVMVALLVSVLDRMQVLRFVRVPLESGLGALHQGVGQVLYQAYGPLRLVWYWRDGTKKISNLEGRLSQVSVDYAQLRSLEEENKALRQIKGIQDKTEFGGGITAKLIKLDQGYGLNVGGIDGVKSGMVVVDDEGVLVGLVETSTTRTSNLLMPEEEGVRLSVRVVGEKTTGVLVGDGRNAVFREVLQAEPLKVGDVLVTTGADGNYPEGLVVGQVVQLVGNASDVTKAAMVDFLYDPTSMVVVGE